MAAYIVRRLFESVFIILGVSIIVFLIMHLSGDPVMLMLPPESTAADAALMRKSLGLDKPLAVQYGLFLKNALIGNFGKSLFANTDAMGLVLERLPMTLLLTFSGLTLALVISLPLGVIAAVKRYSFIDNLSTIAVVFGQAMPSFWLGIMLIIIFSVFWRVFPASGAGTPAHLVLPTVTLGVFLAPILMRLTRSRMLEVLSLDYIRTAHAKGVHELVVLFKHGLRNAIVPVVAIIGLQFGRLLGGAIVVETVFAWPGVASLVVKSIRYYDFPVVQAAALVMSLLIVLTNLVTDIIIAFLDPRIQYK